MKYAASIIIPTYNRSQLLNQTLSTIVEQSQSLDTFEVIVVDDGSSDDTQEVAESYKQKLNLSYYFQEDLGFRAAKARNTGLFNAKSDICIYIDTGILLSKHCIAEHIKSHCSNSEPLAVSGYVYAFESLESDYLYLKNLIKNDHVDNIILGFQETGTYLDKRENYYLKYQDRLDILPAPWITFWSCNISINRQALLAIDGFDENYTTWGAEDVECGYRLFDSGVKFILNRHASAIHAPHEPDPEKNIRTDFASRQYFLRKHQNEISKLYLTTAWDKLNDKLLNTPALTM